MKVSMISGPSHHGPEMLGVLRRSGLLDRAVFHYPAFVVEQGDGAMVEREPLLDLVQRVSWGAWRRVPVLGAYETPRGPLMAAYAWRAARRLLPCDLVIGWQQVSLPAFRRAKGWGARRLLEHPMAHIDAFAEALEEERVRWDRGIANFSDFPWQTRRRIHAEVAEADHISVLSSYARRTFLERGVPAEKLSEVALGVDAERFSPGPRREGPVRVLCVGRLELLKGPQYLLQALRLLPHRDVEVRLVGTLYPEMKPILAELADPRVRVLDSVTPSELAGQYREADLLVFPTVNDALGLVMLEGMASGLPVVASELSGAPDVVREGVDGFVVPARSPAALADRIAWLLDHPARRREMGEAARQRILERYTLEAYAERLLALCHRLVPGR